MECEICGKRLRVYNEHGLTVGLDSCEHWRFCGDVYPYLWDRDRQEELERDEELGLVVLENREQGGYYMWEMTPEHPSYNELLKKLDEEA